MNTAVTVAMPKAAPNRCMVLLTHEARPMSAGATAFSEAVGVAGIDNRSILNESWRLFSLSQSR